MTDAELTMPEPQADITMSEMLARLGGIEKGVTEALSRLAVIEARPVPHSESDIILIVRNAIETDPRIKALIDKEQKLEGMIERFEVASSGVQNTFSREITERRDSERITAERMDRIERDLKTQGDNINRVVSLVEQRQAHGEKQDRQIAELTEESRRGHQENQRLIRALLPFVTSLMGRDPLDPDATKMSKSVFERFDDYETEQRRGITDNAEIRKDLATFTAQQQTKLDTLVQAEKENRAFRERYEQSAAIRRMVWSGLFQVVKSKVFAAAFGAVFGGGGLIAIVKLVEVLSKFGGQ